jgi:hypothetical protein
MTALSVHASRAAASIAFVVAASGCLEIEGRAPAEQPLAGERTRTVDIELLRTAERRFALDADGVASYAAPKPLGGVEICVVAQRAAFHSFEPFEELDEPLCETNQAEATTRLPGLPADSDLLISYARSGFRSVLTTFRTDDHDVAVPSWADNATYFVPMLRADDELPIDAEPEPLGAHGLVAVWVEAVGEYGVGEGVPQLHAGADPGVAPAEGVQVTIEHEPGAILDQHTTRRDRPRFLSLRSGLSFRARFEHPALEIVPVGVQEQFMIMGLPTDRFDLIEVPVRAGHLSLALVDGFCPLPPDPGQPFEDLATCRLLP